MLKCLYLARIGRPDSLWSLVSKQTGSCGPQKWTQACDRRLARLISYIHHTQDNRQYCHVGNTAQRCRLGFFQDSDFAGNLEDSKSTSGGILRLFGSRTFVPVNWDVQETNFGITQLYWIWDYFPDAGLRMDGLPALDLWVIVNEVLRSPQTNKKPSIRVSGNGNEISKVSPSNKIKKNIQGFPEAGTILVLMNCLKWITCPATHNLLQGSPSCTSSRTMKQW